MIFNIFNFYLKNYDGFNCRNLPKETVTLYNVKNGGCCGGLLHTVTYDLLQSDTLYFVMTRIVIVFKIVADINCGD